MSSFRISSNFKSSVGIGQPTIYPPGATDTLLLTNVNGTNSWSYPGYNLKGANFIPSNTVDASSIIIPVGTSNKYIGSALSPAGLIYNIPGSATNVGIVNPYTNTIDTTTISNITPSSYPVIGNQTTDKWSGGVMYQGNLYCVPQASKAILRVNTINNSLSFIDISNVANVAYNYFGAVLSNNNIIYGIPHENTNVLRFNPVTNDVSSLSITGLQTTTTYYAGGVLAPNGLIYGIPFDASSCLVIDTSNNTARADVSGLGNLGLGGGKWLGGVLGQDGKIYGIPFSSNNILVIDPSSNTTSLIASGLTGGNKFYGGTLGMDGKIYCTPHRSTSMLVIDTTRNPVVLSTIPNVNNTNDRWSGSTLSPNGKIYMTTGTSTGFGIVKTSLPSVPSWMLAPQFNKL